MVGCVPPSEAEAIQAGRDLGFADLGIVGLGDAAAVAARDGATVVVSVVRREGDGWVASAITSHRDSGDDYSVHLVSYDNTGDRWNTFVYGSALPGVSRVHLDGFPEQAGGRVGPDGSWLIVLPDEDVTPSDLRTEFLSPTGVVLYEDEGIFPPDA
jgi:hypothetical protein